MEANARSAISKTLKVVLKFAIANPGYQQGRSSGLQTGQSLIGKVQFASVKEDKRGE